MLTGFVVTKVNVALGLGCSSNPQCCKSFDVSLLVQNDREFWADSVKAKAAVAKGCTNGQGVV